MSRAKPSLLERWGESYFRRRSARLGAVVEEDEIYILNPQEQRDLKRIERGAVTRATIAGALSALACAVAALFADPLLGEPGEQRGFSEVWEYWAIVIGVFLVACVIELGFLYWDSLRSVHELSRVAGLELFPEEGTQTGVTNSLVRAALELPAPGSQPETPYVAGSETSPFWLVIAPIVYKLKIAMTSFLLKVLIRRAMGRAGVRAAAMRAYIEFAAIPVCAIWNAIVCRWVIREARVRAIGPSAGHLLVNSIFPADYEMPAATATATRQAIGSAVCRNLSLHPNLASLVDSVFRRTGPMAADEDFSSEAFLSTLKELPADDRLRVLRVFVVALVLDNRLSRWERKLFTDAARAAGLPESTATDLEPIREIQREFVAGDEALESSVVRLFEAPK